MRLIVNLELIKGKSIKLDYAHKLQSLIYSNLPENFSKEVHDGGFRGRIDSKRVYKDINISKLIPAQYEIDKNCLYPKGNISLYISSSNKEMLEGLLDNLYFKPSIKIGENEFVVKPNSHIREFNPGNDKVFKCTTLSPVVYSCNYTENGVQQSKFLSPMDSGYIDKLVYTLRNKYSAFNTDVPLETIEAMNIGMDISSFNRRVVRYKNMSYTAYDMDFELSGSLELIELIYNTGIGSKTAQGFGCIHM